LRSESEAKSSRFCAKRSEANSLRFALFRNRANSHCEFGALLERICWTHFRTFLACKCVLTFSNREKPKSLSGLNLSRIQIFWSKNVFWPNLKSKYQREIMKFMKKKIIFLFIFIFWPKKYLAKYEKNFSSKKLWKKTRLEKSIVLEDQSFGRVKINLMERKMSEEHSANSLTIKSLECARGPDSTLDPNPWYVFYQWIFRNSENFAPTLRHNSRNTYFPKNSPWLWILSLYDLVARSLTFILTIEI